MDLTNREKSCDILMRVDCNIFQQKTSMFGFKVVHGNQKETVKPIGSHQSINQSINPI